MDVHIPIIPSQLASYEVSFIISQPLISALVLSIRWFSFLPTLILYSFRIAFIFSFSTSNFLHLVDVRGVVIDIQHRNLVPIMIRLTIYSSIGTLLAWCTKLLFCQLSHGRFVGLPIWWFPCVLCISFLGKHVETITMFTSCEIYHTYHYWLLM